MKKIIFTMLMLFPLIAQAFAYEITTPGNNLYFGGNVGVSSATPGQAVDVQGTVRSSLGFSGPGSNGKITIVASQGTSTNAGCKLNSNISTGGGTDDSVCLQNDLNALAANAAGGTLIIDGVALVSRVNVASTVHDPIQAGDQTTALMMGNNTKIQFIKGGGLFLAAHSNCPVLGNLISGAVPITAQVNMEIDGGGGTINANAANQDQTTVITGPDVGQVFPCENNDGHNWAVMGLWFGGINGLYIHDLTLHNASTYQFYFTNVSNVILGNLNALEDSNLIAHQDAFHFDGNSTNIYAYNLTNNGDDDTIPLNGTEGSYWYSIYHAAGSYGAGRFPEQTGATIANQYWDNVFFNNPIGLIRFGGLGSEGNFGINAVNNITFHNFYGTVSGQFQNSDSTFLTYGNVLIDGWNLNRGINLGSAVSTDQNITVRNAIFDGYDNQKGAVIQIFGPGRTAIDGVIVNSTLNTGNSNSLVSFNGTQNMSVANVSTNFLSSVFSGGNSNASLSLSNITQQNQAASGIYAPGFVFPTSTNVGIGTTSVGVSGDLNTFNDINNNVSLGMIPSQQISQTVWDGSGNTNIGNKSGTSQWLYQTVECLSLNPCVINDLQLYFSANVGAPTGGVIVQGQNVSANKPSGTLFATTATSTVTPTQNGFNTFTFAAPIVVPPSTSIAFTMAPVSVQTSGNYWNIHFNATSPYPNGVLGLSTNSGSTWTVVSGDDALFLVDYSTLTGSGTTSAYTMNVMNNLEIGGAVGIGTAQPYLPNVVPTIPTGSLVVATGNVGIGSMAPGQALDVQGTLRVSQNLYAIGIGTTVPQEVCITGGRIGYYNGAWNGSCT